MPRPRRYSEHFATSDVAENLGTSNTTVGRYLAGERYPILKTMRQIERIFGWKVVDQIELIPDDGYNKVYGMALQAILDEHFSKKDSSESP
jgi:predicted transcriptional regulator